MAGPVHFKSIDIMLLGEGSDSEVLESSQVPGTFKDCMLGKSKNCAVTTQQPKTSQQKIISPERPLAQSQRRTPPATPVSIGGAFRSPVKKVAKRNRVVRKLCERIGELQEPDNDTTYTDETSPSCSSDGFLEVLSPSASISNTSTKEKIDENTCQICSIEHGSVDDLDFPWIGCSSKGCKYWIHLICLGIECLQENLKFIGKYWCPMHNKNKLVKAKRKLLK